MAMTHNGCSGRSMFTTAQRYSGKEPGEGCMNGNASVETSVCKQLVDMNTTSLSAGLPSDLSHRGSSGMLLQREDSLNKVYPHLVFSTTTAEDRQSDVRELREEYNSHVENVMRMENLEKHSSVGFKHPLWEGADAVPVLPDTHHLSYESSFLSDAHHSRMPHMAAGQYNFGSLLLKESAIPMKLDRNVPHPSMGLTWDKNTAALIGKMCSTSPPSKNRLVCSNSSPADLEEVSEDEKERVRVKRERNRVAAAKCRNRRRELLERLEKEADYLEREQGVWREKVKNLQEEKRKYQSILDEHECECPIDLGRSEV